MKFQKSIIPNLVQNSYITNGNIWVADETLLGISYSLFLLANLKTRAIIAYGLKKAPKKAQLSGDEVLDIYSDTLQVYQKPHIIHTDTCPHYTTPDIRQWCQIKGIKLSTTENSPRQNQVIEAINKAIKDNLIEHILTNQNTTNSFKQWRKRWPNEFKHMVKNKKIRSKSFRKFLFGSTYFSKIKNIFEICSHAVQKYNGKPNRPPLTSNFSREREEHLNKFIKNVEVISTDNKVENFAKSAAIIESNKQAFKVTDETLKAINAIPINNEMKQKLKNQLIVFNKPISIISYLTNLTHFTNPSEANILKAIITTFSIQYQQQQKILESNEILLKRIKILEANSKKLANLNKEANSLIEDLVAYKNDIQRKEEEKLRRKQKYRNREKQPLKNPIFENDYINLIKSISSRADLSEIKKIRLRVSFCILFLTGIRISELNELSLSQTMDLLFRGYADISRKKGGPANHRIQLTERAIIILKERKKDITALVNFLGFQLTRVRKNEPAAFASKTLIFNFREKGNPSLERESITRIINEALKRTFNSKKITSHSFRVGFITQLYSIHNDIYFVKDVVGHRNVTSTAAYIRTTDKQIKERLDNPPIKQS